MKKIIYCPFCVDWFEDIVQHYYDRHERKMIDYKDGKPVYDFPSMNNLMHQVTFRGND